MALRVSFRTPTSLHNSSKAFLSQEEYAQGDLLKISLILLDRIEVVQKKYANHRSAERKLLLLRTNIKI